MSAPLSLSAEFRKIVEERMTHSPRRRSRLQRIIKTQKITPQELKDKSTASKTASTSSSKMELESSTPLILKNTLGFGNIKKILGVNSRTLSG
jgi:hypothetical protein